MFISKQRISEDHFNFIISEGKNKIPLFLEEMKQLEFIQSCMNAWKVHAANQIQTGAQLSSLISNFKKVNSVLFDKPPCSEEQVK